jgi:hypothetical protein
MFNSGRHFMFNRGVMGISSIVSVLPSLLRRHPGCFHRPIPFDHRDLLPLGLSLARSKLSV